jgi:hypothetical protein
LDVAYTGFVQFPVPDVGAVEVVVVTGARVVVVVGATVVDVVDVVGVAWVVEVVDVLPPDGPPPVQFTVSDDRVTPEFERCWLEGQTTLPLPLADRVNVGRPLEAASADAGTAMARAAAPATNQRVLRQGNRRMVPPPWVCTRWTDSALFPLPHPRTP